MDSVLNQFAPPPYNEQESQTKRNNEADRYKIMRRLTIALVFLIWIIFLLSFTVAALLLNPKFQPQWTSQMRDWKRSVLIFR